MSPPNPQPTPSPATLLAALTGHPSTRNPFAPWSQSPVARQIEAFNQNLGYRDVFAQLADSLRPLDRYGKLLAEQMTLADPLVTALAAADHATAFRTSHLDQIASIGRWAETLSAPWKVLGSWQTEVQKLVEQSRRYDTMATRLAQLATRYPTFHDLVPQLDVEKLEAAAAAISSQLRETAKPSQAVPATLEEVRIAFAEPDMAELTAALSAAVHEAVAQVAHTLRPTTRRQWRLVLWIIYGIFQTAITIAGQPLFQRMLDARYPVGKPDGNAAAAPALSQLSVITTDTAFVRIGPHTQQRYVATAHRGEIVRVIRSRGRWALIIMSDHGKDGMTTTGWVKTGQISPLQVQAADVLNDGPVPE